jgi:hypothetical protein
MTDDNEFMSVDLNAPILPYLVQRVQTWKVERDRMRALTNAEEFVTQDEWWYSDQDAVEIVRILAALLPEIMGIAKLDLETWLDQAGTFTCDEAEVVARFLQAAGSITAAEVFLTAHTQSHSEAS